MNEHVIRFHRRDALRWMAASMALASGACTRLPDEEIHPWVNMPEARGDGSPLSYASAVVRDGFAQGVLVTTQDGRPTKVEGNPLHPSSLGATDVFAQAAVLDLWDPDRSQAVTQRPGTIASWAAFDDAWRKQRGEGLRLLTGPITSPSLRAQIAALLKRWPGARWHQYSPTAPFGRDTHPVYRFDRARCIVALASDPFSEGPGAVRHAMDWARRRADKGPARAFAVEVAPGLFGARADHRIALPPQEIEALVAQGLDPAMRAALEAAGRDALIVPGPLLSARSHALVRALHEKLGAIGNTVDYLAPLAWDRSAGSLRDLMADMNAGRTRALVILDANPVYDAPGELAFPAALAKVPFTAHAGLYRDETGDACAWHLPLSHTFEQWGDALAHDGTACVVQPAIAPLYDTRSAHELLALLAGDDVRDGHAIVQRYWRSRTAGNFDTFWRESLRRGVIENSAPAPLRTKVDANIAAAPSRPSGVVAVFTADPSTHDGRFANNAWLQELPRPFTKHTWENALFIGPQTARRNGIETGDVVRVSAAGRELRAPVWVLPAHAENVATLPLGYGRTRAGRIGNGAGFDAYRLMPADGAVIAVTLTPIGHGHEFARTQRTLDASGRPPARTVVADAPVERGPELPSLYERWTYPDHAWAMAIDIDACIGCNACTIACQAENNIPTVGREEVARGRAMHWIRVDAYDAPELANTIFQPVPCMHCEQAPCELVCPVGATMHDSEGVNVQVYNRCIGTRFCSNNCP